MPGLWSVLYTGAINLQEGISNQLLVLCTFGLFMYVTLLHVWQLSKLLVLYSLCYIYLIWKLICIDFFDTRSVNRLFFRFNPRSANAYKINKHHMEKLNTRDLKHHNTWNHSPLVTFQHLTIAHRQAFKPPQLMFHYIVYCNYSRHICSVTYHSMHYHVVLNIRLCELQ